MSLATSGISNKEFSFLCDINSSIHGYYTPKSHILLVSPRHLLDDWVDEVIVFSFGYMKEITDSLTDYTNNGGKLTSLLEVL